MAASPLRQRQTTGERHQGSRSSVRAGRSAGCCVRVRWCPGLGSMSRGQAHGRRSGIARGRHAARHATAPGVDPHGRRHRGCTGVARIMSSSSSSRYHIACPPWAGDPISRKRYHIVREGRRRHSHVSRRSACVLGCSSARGTRVLSSGVAGVGQARLRPSGPGWTPPMGHPVAAIPSATDFVARLRRAGHGRPLLPRHPAGHRCAARPQQSPETS